MSKAKGVGFVPWKPLKIKHATSIGHGPNSKPKNKRKSWKKYRGQGK